MVNARKAVESAYTGVCTVIEFQNVKDLVSRITKPQEVTVTENVPCRVSFESKSAAVPTLTGAAVAQEIRLFLAPEIKIKSGSKVIVTQNGVTTEYAASGVPAVYITHQEIMLELFRGWA